MRASLLFFAACVLGGTASLQAWDYEGHRTVNLLALSALPKDFPDFVKDSAARERIAFLAGEPDRWRNVPDTPVRHATGPDHYLDFEDLQLVGLPVEKLPGFRAIFSAALAEARQAHASRLPPIDSAKNKDRTDELVGFLPWAIAENYGKLKSAFAYLRAYEEAGTADEVANAQANVIYQMGVLGHYVGDGAQPLHTTKHHNGWVGENPQAFTVSKTFHAWIDGGFLRKTGGLDLDDLLTRAKPARLLNTRAAPEERDPIFEESLTYLLEQHGQVEPLYVLEKNGHLDADGARTRPARLFLEEQILRGAHMLSSLWYTAWRDAPADLYLRNVLAKRKLP